MESRAEKSEELKRGMNPITTSRWFLDARANAKQLKIPDEVCCRRESINSEPISQ
jgi:hypothetical protein